MSNPNNQPRVDAAKPVQAGTGGSVSGDPPKPAPMWRVLDTTARPGSFRAHEMMVEGIVKTFTFHHGEPVELAKAVALKFLKHDSFKLIDAKGNVVDFRRRPKQPDEMQAGEAFKISDDETIARLDELTMTALQHRCVEMLGGEKFVDRPDRDAMIAFITEAKKANKKANSVSESPGRDDFLPPMDDEAA